MTILEEIKANPTMLQFPAARDSVDEFLKDEPKEKAFAFFAGMLASTKLEPYYDVQVWMVERITKIEIWSGNQLIRPDADFYTNDPDLYEKRLAIYSLLK